MLDHQMRERRFSALADRTRLGIVELLADKPLTATEIHRAFPIAAPAVSRHLRVLREAGLIEERRPEHDRRVRLYSLGARPLQELSAWLTVGTGAWQQQLDAFEAYVAVRHAGRHGVAG